MNDYNFGNFICMLREQKGMTQADIADRLGVTPAAVSKWENGSSKPRVEVPFQLANILGVRSEELMAGHYLPIETLDPEVVQQINERYNYLRKVDCHNTAGVKFRRFLAAIIDWNLVGLCVLFSLGFFMSFFKNRLSTDSAVFILGMLFIFSLYPAGFILRDVLFGSRSIGKRITGLIVFDKQTGMPAKAGKRILRNLFLPIMQADVIVMFASGSTVGDRVARTVVLPRKIAETTSDVQNQILPTSTNTPPQNHEMLKRSSSQLSEHV